MSRIWLGIAAAAVLVAAASSYAVFILPEQHLRSVLDEQLQHLPAGVTVHYDSAHYSLMSGHATIAGVVVHAANEHPLDLAIDTIEIENPALDAAASWSRAAIAPSTIKPGTVLRLADSVVARGLSMKSEAISSRLDMARVEAPRIYPADLLRPEIGSFWATEMALLTRTQPPTLDDMAPLFRAEAAILAGIAYDGYVIENLHATSKMAAPRKAAAMPSAAALPSGPIDVAYDVRRASVGRGERGTIGEIAVDDLTMRLGLIGTATIAHVKGSGFDVRPALERVLAGAALAPKLLDGVKLGHIEYDGIRFQPPTGDAFTLGTFSLDNLAFDQGVPISADLAYGGLHLSRAQLAAGHPAFDELKELGIDGMTLSLRVAYLWNPDQNRVAIHDTNFKIDELGALGLSADIDLASLAGATWASTAKITHAALRYDDASLVDRALRFSASRQNITPGAVREQMVGMLTQQATAPGASPAVANAAKALADFIATPHSLTVELTPPAPIALAVLQIATAVGTPQLVRMLGLTVTTAP